MKTIKQTIIRYYFFGVMMLFTFLGANAQQFYVGTPVNQTFINASGYDNTCFPQPSWGVSVSSTVFPYPTGVNLAFKITAINASAGTVYSTPGTVIKTGDTLALPSIAANGGYEFFFSSGGSSVSIDLIAYGTPQTVNQTYTCNFRKIMAVDPCPDYTAFMPHLSFSPCTVLAAVSVPELAAAPFVTVSPNPSAGGLFTVNNLTAGPLHVSVTDMLGKNIQEKILSSDNALFDLRTYRKGMYFLRITDEEKKMLVIKKIIME